MPSRGPLATWNLVLAAGEGRRLLPLTRALYGTDLPKQFAAFDGGRTLLQRTIERIRPLAPPERTVVVVPESHAGRAREQLAPWPGIEVVEQPSNVGTAPGTMLPLARILARDPQAEVLIFPADHHFARPDRVVQACRSGLAAAAITPSGVALVGAPAERPAADLGWIVPGDRLDPILGARAVERFIEKPDEATAMKLLAARGLWNTLILGGSAAGLWRLLRRHLPRQAALMAPLRTRETRSAPFLHRLYGRLDSADLSRDVLEKDKGLGVVCMVDSGWSDLGTPERLLAGVGRSRKRELSRRLDAIRAPDVGSALVIEARTGNA